MGALAALLPSLFSLLGNFIPSLKDYAAYKQQQLQYQQQYQLALLQAQAAQATQQITADSQDLQYRLNATTPTFKQITFWLVWVPVLYSMFFPVQAQAMWHNFELIPEMFQWLYMGMYASIWGFPLAKGSYGAITDLLMSRWDKKIEHASVNYKVIFDTLKQLGVFTSYSQEQVDKIQQAIQAGLTQQQ